jgi:23S rRNA U2552 (ribose-2'-O)-methylase RlmE/FtsJ
MTKPSGRVLGVDLLPAQPPKGVSTFQGDFTSPDIQADIISFLRDPERGRPRRAQVFAEAPIPEDVLHEIKQSYLDKERQSSAQDLEDISHDEHDDKVVDVVLSDMWEPWEQTDGRYTRSLSNPYFRLMNTSGNAFRDHTRSIVRPPLPQVHHLLTHSGPLPLSPALLLQHPQVRRALRVQILPGSGRQSVREKHESHVPQGSSREARELEEGQQRSLFHWAEATREGG